MEDDFFIEAGDIFLVTGKNLMSKPIAKGQKAFYPKAISSHILIAISDGIYIHATSDKGVNISTFIEELPNIEDTWRAIRLKNLSSEDKDNLLKSVLHYLGQDYNTVYFTSSDSASFCSELAAKIYKQAKISIMNNKEPHKVIPADFDREADQQIDWEDITDKTKKCFEKLENDSRTRTAYLSYKMIIMQVLSRRKRHIMLDNIFLNSNIISEEAKEEYKKVKQEIANKVEISYWDDNFKKE